MIQNEDDFTFSVRFYLDIFKPRWCLFLRVANLDSMFSLAIKAEAGAPYILLSQICKSLIYFYLYNYGLIIVESRLNIFQYYVKYIM